MAELEKQTNEGEEAGSAVEVTNEVEETVSEVKETKTEETTDLQPAETEEEAEEKAPVSTWKGLGGYLDRSPKRTNIMHLIAGAYMIYLGYELCSGYLAKAEGAAIGFFLAGIAFFLIGAGLVALGGLALYKKMEH